MSSIMGKTLHKVTIVLRVSLFFVLYITIMVFTYYLGLPRQIFFLSFTYHLESGGEPGELYGELYFYSHVSPVILSLMC